MESAHIYRLPLVIGGVSVICIILSILLLVKSTQTPEPIVITDGDIAGDTTIGLIKVDVEGAVSKPGVYSLPADARIEDAIHAAGGITPDADTDYIAKKMNKAARVVDGGKIFIPKVDSSKTSHNNSFATKDSNVASSQNYSGIIATPGTSSQNAADALISINDATISELDSLPGIGPVTAQKIIDNRPYQTIEELLTRKAVGQSVYNKILDLISL